MLWPYIPFLSSQPLNPALQFLGMQLTGFQLQIALPASSDRLCYASTELHSVFYVLYITSSGTRKLMKSEFRCIQCHIVVFHHCCYYNWNRVTSVNLAALNFWLPYLLPGLNTPEFPLPASYRCPCSHIQEQVSIQAEPQYKMERKTIINLAYSMWYLGV